MIEELKPKTQPVSKQQVWSAWKHVKRGGKGLGIDQVSMDEIACNPRKYLYPLWNRLASGSYFPPPVKEVPIPKGNGTNVSGFNALPAGNRHSGGSCFFANLYRMASFWTSTPDQFYRQLRYNIPGISKSEYWQWIGLSVRCMKDD